MAPEAVARGLTAGLVACCLAIACSRGASDLLVVSKVQPEPPVAGAVTTIRFTLEDRRRGLVEGAKLRLEAHMSHPGMAPVAADVTEPDRGHYQSQLRLSMAGDWVFVVTGTLADGSRITKSIEVHGVQSAEEPAAAR